MLIVMFIYSKHTPPLMYKRRHPPWRCCEAFHPLSWLSCWLFFFCFKTVSIHELSQDKLPRSTKVVSIWPMLLEKGRRSCYKLKLCHHLLLISKGAQIVTHLSCRAVVIHNFKIECCTFSIFCPNGLMRATAKVWRWVELSSMRLINIWPLSTFLMPLQGVCPVFKFQRSA